ncbi:MAG: hypothetical protein COC19_03560 [SAR86 cluster bacterium]|uniref:DUF5916 domain-containing protein n=1 Tax=SAR86 cluster bacterium TaxID=2030880 RepID=A0A2A4MQU5_9GAMM|nr:MAG: hypothetical protein COC19_03560 [SAR86 cluster bacterium]
MLIQKTITTKRIPIKLCLGLLSLVIGFTSSPLLAQDSKRQLTQVEESEANIVLDGFVDEAVWQQIPVIDGMKVIDPDTLEDAPYETHTRIFYTQKGIYVGVINYQDPDTLVARMTSRDTQLDRDGFVVGLDPSGEGLYGYFLRINLGDSITDGTILPERQLNMQWDGSWDARTQALDNGWSVEYFIPWSMMALPQADETRKMGIYLERQIGHLGGEAWSWPALPSTVNQYLSAFEKFELQDIEPRRQLTFYPYATAIYDNITGDSAFKAGAEIFWRPTTNSLVSASINPDFGTVESDDVVVNLSAFETFFSEKRSFFLEGQDIFNTSPRTSGRGGPGGPITLLNTRRIGGASSFDVPDGVTVNSVDTNRPTDLLGAVKLTGQVGKLRYGTLLASEDDSSIRGTDEAGNAVRVNSQGRDFSIMRLLYEDTSSGGRRSIGWMGTDVSHPDVDARVNAIDAHYFSADNRWLIDGQVMHSDVDGETGAGLLADVSFRPRRGVQHSLRGAYIDDTFNINNLGYIQRNDQVNLDYSYSHNESDIEGLRSRNTSVFVTNRWNTAGQPVLTGAFFNRGYTFLDSDNLNYSVRYFPPRIDDRLGQGSGDFRMGERWGANLGFNTDRAKSISYQVGVNLGQEVLGPGQITSFAGITWRPDDRFSLSTDLNYTDREALLVYQGDGQYTSFEATQWAPRAEMNYFITAKQQLRFSMQWTALKAFENKFWQVNSERREFLQEVNKTEEESDDFVISRLTFQVRYRWEIAPLSDLFLVYTRGSNLPSNTGEDYFELLERSWKEEIVDSFAIKLRYRLGS